MKNNEPIKRFQELIHKHAGIRLYAAGLFGLMALAYLPFVGGMGYNYDDWEGVYLFTQGMSRADVWRYFVIDRPFSSLIHFAFYPIFGTNVTVWHTMAMSLLWGAILFFVLSGLRLFPTRALPIAWAGVLLAVYPGITRQFVAFTTMPHYTSMFLFAFSLWAMLRALDEEKKSNRWFWRGLSWLAALAQVFIIEYFALMEIARLFVLVGVSVQRRNMGSREDGFISQTTWVFRHWLPYAAALGLFLFFKFSVLPAWATASGTVSKHEIALFEEIAGAPVATLAGAINLIAQDIVYQFGSVWLAPLSAKDLDVSSKSYLASWLVGGLAAGTLALIIQAWDAKKRAADEPDRSTLNWIALGFGLTLVLGGLPAWMIGRQGTVGLWSSRFFLAQVLGSIPLFVLVVMLFIGWKRPKAASVFFALLAMGGVAYQFREGNRYKLYWDAQRDYYWQLKTRAPGLVDGAFIAAPATPFARTSDYQIAYAVDLLYNADDPAPRPKNWWFDAPDDLLHKESGGYKDRAVWSKMRNIEFDSKMSMALPVLYAPSRGCMQVLVDDYYAGEPNLTEQEMGLFPLARNGLVMEEGSIAPAAVFGQAPAMNWCAYYQLTEKYRAAGDWDAIYELWVNTISVDEHLRSNYGPEYLPFIESFARAGDWERAATWSLKAGKITKEARGFLCQRWGNTLYPLGVNSKDALDAWQAVKTEFGC